MRNSYNSGTVDIFASNDHYLLDAKITAIGPEQPSTVPAAAQLFHNFPNPFNPTTTIYYSVPVAEHVRLDVFDPLGRKVACLADGTSHPGHYQVVWNAVTQATGIYFLRLQAGPTVLTQSLILIK
jgi:hypothetical protein